MHKKTFLATLAMVLGFVAHANAVNIDLILSVDETQHTWEVRAAIVDPSLSSGPGQAVGLQGFDLQVVGGNGIEILSSFNRSPGGFTSNSATGPTVDIGAGPTNYRETIAARRNKAWGFSEGRSDGDFGLGIRATQPTSYGNTPSADSDYLVQQGLGLTAGLRFDRVDDGFAEPFDGSDPDPINWIGFTSPDQAPQGDNWDAAVLLASGVYGGEFLPGSNAFLRAELTPGSFFNVLKGSSPWVGPGNVEGTRNVNPSAHVAPPVPEPSSIVLAGLAVVGLAGVVLRRKG